MVWRLQRRITLRFGLTLLWVSPYGSTAPLAAPCHPASLPPALPEPAAARLSIELCRVCEAAQTRAVLHTLSRYSVLVGEPLPPASSQRESPALHPRLTEHHLPRSASPGHTGRSSPPFADRLPEKQACGCDREVCHAGSRCLSSRAPRCKLGTRQTTSAPSSNAKAAIEDPKPAMGALREHPALSREGC